MADKLTIPVYKPDEEWRFRHIKDIYTGPTGTGHIVPNIGDWVIDPINGFQVVTDLDVTTYLSTLTPWERPKGADEDSVEDLLLGGGPGTVSESFRCLIDTSVTPYRMSLSRELHMYGNTVKHMRVFAGTDISSKGVVISAYYDQNGQYQGNLIPMQIVAQVDTGNLYFNRDLGVENTAIKSPANGYSTKVMQDGDVVTAVFYDDVGGACSVKKLIVMNTSFIPKSDHSQRVIKSIRLESSFLSDADKTLLQYPINMPVANLPLTGVVTYSDGEERHPVDGSRFKLHGLTNFISNLEGQTLDLVLTYYLAEDEILYDGEPLVTRQISRQYRATTTALEEAYSVKLFTYPVWVDATVGYRLTFFLANLNRRRIIDVTPWVKLAAGTKGFDPTNYRTLQRLQYSVNLKDVDSTYPSYRHTQIVPVTLHGPGTDPATNWTVNLDPNDGSKVYGVGLEAHAHMINAGNYDLKLDNGHTNIDDWLDALYYATVPLINPNAEAKKDIKPNMFTLMYGVQEATFDVDQWNEVLRANLDLEEGETLYIKWVQRHTDGDLMMGISGLPVHKY